MVRRATDWPLSKAPSSASPYRIGAALGATLATHPQSPEPLSLAATSPVPPAVSPVTASLPAQVLGSAMAASRGQGSVTAGAFSAMASAIELDRKEQTIAALRAQVAKLEAYQDRAEHLQRRMESVEAAARQRETTTLARNAELVAKIRHYEENEARIEGQLAFLEEARIRETQRYRAELDRLQAGLDDARSIAAAAKARVPADEAKIHELNTLLDRAKEREDAHLRHTSKLQDEVAQLRKTLRDHDSDLVARARELRDERDAHERTRKALATAEDGLARSQSTHQQLAAELGEANGRIDSLTQQRDAAAAAAAVVPELREAAARIPVLLADVAAATARADEARAEAEALEARLAATNSELHAARDTAAAAQHELDTFQSRYVRPLSPSSELSKLKAAHENLALQAAETSEALAAAQRKVAETEDDLAAAADLRSVIDASLTRALAILQDTVDAGIRGDEVSSEAGKRLEDIVRDDALLGQVGPMVSGLHNRISDVLANLSSVRKANHGLKLEVDTQTAEHQATRHKLAETEAALVNAQTELAEAGELAEARHARTTALESQLAELASVSAADSGRNESRLQALFAVVTALSNVACLASTPLASAPAQPEWNTVVAYLQAAPAHLGPHLEDLRARHAAAEQAAADALAQARTEASVEMDKQTASQAAIHAAEVATLRDQIHDLREELARREADIVRANASRGVAEQAAEVAASEAAVVSSSHGAALRMVELLVRAYRAMRLRNKELIAQKRFLSAQARKLGAVTSSIHTLRLAVVGQLTGETLEAPSGRPRISFRGAVIAVIAGHRLARLAVAFAARGASVDDNGRAVVELAPPDRSHDPERVPLRQFMAGLASGEREGAEGAGRDLVKLLGYFDATGVDEDLHFSSMLLAALASGQVGHAWWRAQIGARSQGTVSDVAAVFERDEGQPLRLDPVAPLRGLAVVRKTVLDLVTRLQIAESDAAELAAEFTRLESVAAEASDAATRATNAEATVAEALDVAQLRVRTLESQLEGCVAAGELSDAQARLADAERRVVALEDDVARAVSERDARVAEAAEAVELASKARARAQEVTREHILVQERAVASKAEARRLEAALDEERDRVRSLTQQLHEAQVVNTRVQSELVAAQASAESQAQLHQRVADELDAAREQVRKLESEAASTSASASVHSAQMLRLNTQLEETRAALEAARSRVGELEREVARQAAKSNALEQSMVVSRDHMADLHREAMARQARLDAASREAESFRDFRARLAATAGRASGPAPGVATTRRGGLGSELSPGDLSFNASGLDGAALRSYVADLDAQLENRALRGSNMPSPVPVVASERMRWRGREEGSVRAGDESMMSTSSATAQMLSESLSSALRSADRRDRGAKA
ncbi:uncharacterized protein AMSG_09988 [Thecamonas trahens ATCC 50062]|uniref:Uncharacterized protein n=1 Tax=Thecamonas trahens ATCC 50062 TaxID=461836 RepID=A0A0L0DPG7_THETB|nr:hypothetical protein AMSG_09988 [Thecamonas trahens ATCC 50062]KNC54199.1 hypothetical protein AMSG_09988 [Thecamonas trahens ATCC 50062]|eukprot:XP_013753839.1 hypothetical protein AMSG_09988 [Thecamonas trahens ATCC 50062]